MKILLALDGSESSAHTFDAAMSFLGALSEKPTVYLVYVREPIAVRRFETVSIALEALEKQSQEQAEQLLQPFADRLAGSGFDYSRDVLVGDPAEAICDCARQHGCQMIVMGTRGTGAFSGWLLGSVANKVLHRATVPVLLVPAPRTAKEEAYEGFAFPN